MAPQRSASAWKHSILLVVLLVQLSPLEVGASCRILRCNSEFVAATLDLGGAGGVGGAEGGGAGGGGAASYCSALRSYALCTRRMGRACRGDLAYHSAVQGIEDLLLQNRCPRAGPTSQPRPLASEDSCPFQQGLLAAAANTGRPLEYLHCGVFGDPHVRTFSDDFHSCAVQGAWPLIDNDFLYVQATSSPVRAGSHATALTKITVIFKSWRQCVDEQLYQAELDHVPAAFADGSVASGERRLTVRTQSTGRHAEIRAAHIDTLLVVRQSGRSLGLSVRVPRAVVEAFGAAQDLQLCVWGCPASQRLSTPLPIGGGASAGARAHCAALLPVPDIYQQACVFDLLAAGDFNASLAAVAALQDARTTASSTHMLHLMPPPTTAGTQGAAPPPPHLLWLLLLALLGSLMVEGGA